MLAAPKFVQNRIIMRQYLLVLCLIASVGLVAQDQAIMRKFNRPTVANVVLTFDETSVPESRVGESFQYLAISNKVNVADVDKNVVWFKELTKDQFNALEPQKTKQVLMDKIRTMISADIQFFPPTDALGPQLANLLKAKKVGGEIFKDWATKDQEGTYSVIRQRTQLNITTDDIKRNTDAEKVEVFRDMIKTNYIFVYHLPQILQKVTSESSSSEELDSYKSKISVYVFKVDVSDALFNKEIAPQFDNARALMEVDYPLSYVGMAKIENNFSPYTLWNVAQFSNQLQKSKKERKDLSTFNSDTLYGVNLYYFSEGIKVGRDWEKLDPKEQDRVLYGHLTKTLMDEVVKLAEMNLEDFKVRAPITSTKPILSPVGIREGISPDLRFRVYENVNTTGKVESKSVGIVRSFGFVGDNANALFDDKGEPIVTRFKQEFGRKLREDMYMVQETNYGIGLSVGLKSGYFNQEVAPNNYFNVRGIYNISRYINNLTAKPKTTGLYSYFGLAYGLKKIEVSSTAEDDVLNILDLQFGLEKRLYFSPKFDIIPDAGLSFLLPFLLNEENQEVETIGYLNTGVRGAFWIKEGLAIEAGFHLPLIRITVKESGDPASFIHFNLSTRLDF
jgi:hypothetical protein